jgi:replication factor A1
MMKIEDLRTYSRRVNLIAKIIEIREEREVSSSSDGQRHRVAEALIGDETGTVLLTLWDENIDRFIVNDVVEIKNGYSGTFRDQLRLNVGRYGEIDKVDQSLESINMENNMSKKEPGLRSPRRRR